MTNADKCKQMLQVLAILHLSTLVTYVKLLKTFVAKPGKKVDTG